MGGHRPIIVVTGANNGVGFGICHRLLFQLAEASPPDSRPPFDSGVAESQPIREGDLVDLPCKGLTLIMACRSQNRADAARARLLKLIDDYVAKRSRLPGDNDHARRFRANLEINVHLVDLAMLSSVMQFTRELAQTYPYISHLIFNAGVASFERIYWPGCFKQLLLDPMGAISFPEYYIQAVGELSIDGYGWIWQCNIFGHYVMFRQLQTLLTIPSYPHDSRVVWVSSLEGKPKFYTDPDDWQLRKTEYSYECSKYQADLIASALDHRALQTPESERRVRHFVAHPGVCHTNIAHSLIGPFLDFVKWALFYVGRWFGSKHHTITPYNGAISAVYLSLVPLAYLTFSPRYSPSSKSSDSNDSAKGHARSSSLYPAIKYAAENRRGTPKVGFMEVQGWNEFRPVAEKLVDRCEETYQKELEERRREPRVETASEGM